MDDLRAKVAKLFSLSIIDLIVSRFGRYLGILILIGVVSSEEIGILGIATGYLAFVGYLSFAPESILLRDYKEHRGKLRDFNHLISAFGNFWVLRSALILLVGFIISLFLKDQSIVLAIVFIGLLLQKLLESFTNFIELIFYVDFKQGIVVKVNFVDNVFLLLSFLLIYLYQSIYTFLILIIINEFILAIIWLFALKRYFYFRYEYKPQWLSLIRKNIWEFTFWYHLSNTTMSFIQNIGPLILSFFVSLAVVGDFTIALKITTFFFLLSQLMQKASFVHFANEIVLPQKISYRTLIDHAKIYGAISLVGIATFAFFGKFLIFHLLTKENIDLIYQLVLIMLVGFLIYNLTRPFMAYASAKLPLQSGFLNVYLPVLFISILIYIPSAKYFGPIGLSFATISSYTILLFLIINFVLRFHHVNRKKQYKRYYR